ncbi:MAG: alpha/beta hydrolase [Candidatus Krumholzibacteriia bacterium]
MRSQVDLYRHCRVEFFSLRLSATAVCVLALLFAAFAPPCGVLPAAAAEPDPTGDWHATLDVPGAGELHLVLHVKPARGGKGWRATLDSPDQRATGLAIDSFRLKKDRTVTFAMHRLNARFEGRLDATGEQMTGHWIQTGRLPATFVRQVRDDATVSAAAAGPEIPAELEGLWQGDLKLPTGMSLRLVLEVEPPADGSGRRRATLASPDQGAADIPMSSISLAGDTLRWTAASLDASYEGLRAHGGRAFNGILRQHGFEMPLELARTETVTTAQRPQEPQPPFPYEAHEVSLPGGDEGVKLAGTLTLPRGEGPVPAVLLVSGSGPQDRDETVFGHRPFLVLADHLTRRGIAVLRLDDRGVGASTGDFAAATTEDFAADALAALEYLSQLPEVAGGCTGILGHSEGGLVGPLVAARSSAVAFLVLLAAPGLPGDEIILAQSELHSRAMGASESALAAQADLLRRTLPVLMTETDPDTAVATLQRHWREVMAALPEAERLTISEGAEPTPEALRGSLTPWIRFFLAHDPRPVLEKVTVPVLAVTGEKDLQVPADENLAAVAAALAAGGNTEVTVRKMPGLNHLFQTADTGMVLEYANIDETMSPAVLDLVADWILSSTEQQNGN